MLRMCKILFIENISPFLWRLDLLLVQNQCKAVFSRQAKSNLGHTHSGILWSFKSPHKLVPLRKAGFFFSKTQHRFLTLKCLQILQVYVD